MTADSLEELARRLYAARNILTSNPIPRYATAALHEVWLVANELSARSAPTGPAPNELREAIEIVDQCRRLNTYDGGVFIHEERCSGVPTKELAIVLDAATLRASRSPDSGATTPAAWDVEDKLVRDALQPIRDILGLTDCDADPTDIITELESRRDASLRSAALAGQPETQK